MTDQNAPGARHPDYIRAVFERAVTMIQAGRLDGADVLLKTLSGEPSTEEAVAETLVAAGRAREARAQFAKAIELEPQSAAPHAAYAMALQKLRAPKEAIEHFHRAIMIDQNQPAEFYASLGAALEAMGMRDRAEVALQHAAALAQAS